MGSRGQSRKRQLAQLDRASEKYNSLQEHADHVYMIGNEFVDTHTGKSVPREEVEKLDKDLKEARERFEYLRDKMIERDNAAAQRAKERAEKRQATREKQSKNKRETAGEWIKNQTNVDIEKYRDDETRKFDRRGYITIDWKSMPQTERAYLEDIARRYPNRLQMFDMGSWGKQLKFNQVKQSKTPAGMRVTFPDGTQRYYAKGPNGSVVDERGLPVESVGNMSYRDLLNRMATNNAGGFRVENVSSADLNRLQEEYNKSLRDNTDYELGIGTPWDNREYRRGARRNRLANRSQTRNR